MFIFDTYVLFCLKLNMFQDKVTVKRLKGSAVVVSEVIDGETGKLLHRKSVFCQSNRDYKQRLLTHIHLYL